MLRLGYWWMQSNGRVSLEMFLAPVCFKYWWRRSHSRQSRMVLWPAAHDTIQATFPSEPSLQKYICQSRPFHFLSDDFEAGTYELESAYEDNVFLKSIWILPDGEILSNTPHPHPPAPLHPHPHPHPNPNPNPTHPTPTPHPTPHTHPQVFLVSFRSSLSRVPKTLLHSSLILSES